MMILFIASKNAYANWMEETSIVNEAQIGEVSIRIVDSKIQSARDIVPGQKIKHTATIVNETFSEIAYLRIKVEHDMLLEGEGVCEEFENDWVRRGEFYYCLNPVGAGEVLVFSQWLRLDESIKKDEARKILCVDTYAQAIQQENFIPDFEKEEPWTYSDGTQIPIMAYEKEGF